MQGSKPSHQFKTLKPSYILSRKKRKAIYQDGYAKDLKALLSSEMELKHIVYMFLGTLARNLKYELTNRITKFFMIFALNVSS